MSTHSEPQQPTDTAQQQQSVQAISAKLPTFYEHNPAGWIINVEAQFQIARITSEKTRFYHAVASLSQGASDELQFFLETECARNHDTPYSNLKNELLRVYSRRKSSKMTELLNMSTFNEKGAQSTLRRLRTLATDIDTMLQCKLISMAPPSARTAVSGKEYENAELLAEALDDAMENDRLSIASVSTSLPSAEEINTPVCAIRHGKPRESTTRTSSCNICFYHERFGCKAKKCGGPPCKFYGLMQQENSKASHQR